MASTSESSFGARLGNSRIILEYLTTFTNYELPKVAYIPLNEEQSIIFYRDLVNKVALQNDEVAASIQGYTLAVDTRQTAFAKGPASLNKVLAPISATVRAAFGKKSKEATSLASMVTKIRGIKVKKNSKQPDAEFVSQSERSYNSLTQAFADIISSLDMNRGVYNPANPSLQIDSLKDQLQTLINNNLAVANIFLTVKQKRDGRTNSYQQLKDLTQRIKESVKAQYGTASTEYKSIKSLQV